MSLLTWSQVKEIALNFNTVRKELNLLHHNLHQSVLPNLDLRPYYRAIKNYGTRWKPLFTL
jgi:hypothetical protein